jgi:hypothetical protein
MMQLFMIGHYLRAKSVQWLRTGRKIMPGDYAGRLCRAIMPGDQAGRSNRAIKPGDQSPG